MKALDILLKAGETALSIACPAAIPFIGMANSMLPADKQLPMNATGKQVHEAIQTLPPDQQAMLLSKQLDVEMAEIHSFTAIQESLAKADIAGSSTRPEIAKMMATVVCFAVVAFVSAWVVALFTKQAAMEQVSGSWPVMLTALGTPTALLRSYFGLRTKEKNGRYGIALGQAPQPSPLASLAGALFGGKQ